MQKECSDENPPLEDRLRRMELLLAEGVPNKTISKLTGVCPETSIRYRRAKHGLPARMSAIYPVSEFVEQRLRCAAEHNVPLYDAAQYAGVAPSTVRGVWKALNHNYLTTVQEQNFREAVFAGANMSQIVRHTGLRHIHEVKYFLGLLGLELQEYDSKNRFVSRYRYKK